MDFSYKSLTAWCTLLWHEPLNLPSANVSSHAWHQSGTGNLSQPQCTLSGGFHHLGPERQWGPQADSKTAIHNIHLQIYALDGIRRFETELSKYLPVDLKHAKQIALEHIQQLDANAMAAMQQAAIGLVKALQYGIDYYPSIVFDGKAVVYGVIDLESALGLYRQWFSELER